MRRPQTVVVLALALGMAAIVPAQTKVKDSTASPALAKAQKALDKGRYAEALKQGSAVAAKDPKRWEAHRLVARAAFMLDQPDRAEAAYRQSLRFAPSAARPSLQNGLKDVESLRSALAQIQLGRTKRTSGDLVGAAKAMETAYRALPSRYAYGLAAAELYESAERFDDATRLLKEIYKAHPAATAATNVPQRLATLANREAAARKTAAEALAHKQEDDRKAALDRQAEADRRAAAEARRGQEAERKRVEAETQAEEERRRQEKIRLDREETERLNGLLNEQKTYLKQTESALKSAEDAVDDAQRDVRRRDDEADDLKGKRDRAKREVEKWEDKIAEAKTEIGKDVYRNELRSAQSAYDDAKEAYNRADRRHDEARSRLSAVKTEVDAARQRLAQARQAIRDTEDALTRVGG